LPYPAAGLWDNPGDNSIRRHVFEATGLASCPPPRQGRRRQPLPGLRHRAHARQSRRGRPLRPGR